jgi:diguanylate cyclase (GGDEF)-like protein
LVTPAILNASALATWMAARVFNRGYAGGAPFLCTIALAFLILMVLDGMIQNRFTVALGVTCSAAFYAAAAVEFWIGRSEHLQGRAPLVSLLCLEAAALLLASVEIFDTTHALAPLSINWFAVIHFVGLVYSVGAAIFVIAMLKQRAELAHRTVALTDALTGLLNRRGFMEAAQRILTNRKAGALPVSLLLFDLDRFKSINDRFGHVSGDAVLHLFAQVLSNKLRRTDIIGRLGGEEFAVVLPDCDARMALGRASRVRTAFQDRAKYVDGIQVDATVSAGVATFSENALNVNEMIASADRALYQAKAAGRNRVMLARSQESSGPENVIRIA